MDAAIALVKPGTTTAECVTVAQGAEFGFANEEAAFGLQYGHGIGYRSGRRPISPR